VSAISAFAFLAILVVPPPGQRGFDVALLPLLGSAGEEDHDCLAVLAKLESVARPEIDLELEHA
jgi:hypothetical protein